VTPLPSRLRASAQAMRGLFLVSENVPNVRMIYKEDRDRIAAELTEAADALEAGRHSGGSEGLHETGFHAWAETQGFTGTEVHAAADAWLEAWNRAAPAAQVAQEGAAGVATGKPCEHCGLRGRHYDGCPAACGVTTDQPNQEGGRG
jgi:hypothetical protein